MAVTLTVAELLAALRMGSSTEETAEATRLLAYASGAVVKYAPDAPDTAHNEAAIRVAGYLFDQPFASRDSAYANALRNSGAASILLAYRVHRAGSVGNAVSDAIATGTATNPVIGITVAADASTMAITYADGTVAELTLPASLDADGVRALVSDWAETGNSDPIPADKLANAPAGVGAYPWATAGNTDPIPADKLANAPAGVGGGGGGGGLAVTLHSTQNFNVTIAGRWIETNLTLPPASATWMLVSIKLGDVVSPIVWVKVSDFLAMTAVVNGGAFNSSDPHVRVAVSGNHYVDIRPGTRGRIALHSTATSLDPMPLTIYLATESSSSSNGTGDDAFDWATVGNDDLIPAAKLANAPRSGNTADILGGRSQGVAVAMRIGWNQTRQRLTSVFVRANDHPVDGAAVGTTAGLASPVFPPALATDATLYQHVWVATTASAVAAIRRAGVTATDFATAQALTVDGVAGVVYISNERLPVGSIGTVYDVVIAGPEYATEPQITALDGRVTTLEGVPAPMMPTAGGGFSPTLLGSFTPPTSGASRHHRDTGVALPASGWLMLLYGGGGNGSPLTNVAYVPVASVRALGAATTNTTSAQPGFFIGSAGFVAGYEIGFSYFYVGHTAAGNLTFRYTTNLGTPGPIAFYSL